MGVTDTTGTAPGGGNTTGPVPAGGRPVGTDRWIRTFRMGGHGVARLVCFPPAGGATGSFTALSAALPDDIEVLAVQYPGRQDRRAEPFAGDIRALAAGAAQALAAYTENADRPLFLLGHSLGALVAFETALALEERGAALSRLFVSAAQPPTPDWDDQHVDATDTEVIDHLRLLRGVPEVLLEDPGMVQEMLRLMRGDHAALRGYRGKEGDVLAAPVTVLHAVEDPKNSIDQEMGWSRHTSGGYTMEHLRGGHFAVTERDSGAAALLAHSIHQHLAGAAGAVEDAAPSARSELVREVYLRGMAGHSPRLSTDLVTLEAAAREVMSPTAYGYVAGNAGTGTTGGSNRAAFDRQRLVPRMLRGAADRDLSVTLFGQRLSAPVLLAPVAAQTVAHPEGELATVRGAKVTDVPFVLSTLASRSLEEVAAAAGSQPRWFQLYWPADRAVAESLVRRAETNGYTALVLTVDAPTFGYRPSELDHAHLPFLHGAGLANFTGDPAFRAGLPEDADDKAVALHWAGISANPSLTWDELPWLRDLTDMPILVKGVLHPDDAREAISRGMDGLVVSNHGGRQLDGAIAALDALPTIRAAVGDSVPVLMDSGIRSGSDALKALALGADAVMLGRPYLYGLALDGQQGVEHVLRCFLADLDLALALTGHESVADLTPDLLAPS